MDTGRVVQSSDLATWLIRGSDEHYARRSYAQLPNDMPARQIACRAVHKTSESSRRLHWSFIDRRALTHVGGKFSATPSSDVRSASAVVHSSVMTIETLE